MKSFFYYGPMNSSKSAQLLMSAHNYESNGKDIIYIKPKEDSRERGISSRIGASRDADYIVGDNRNEIDDIINRVYIMVNMANVKAIFIDEAQFLSPYFIHTLLLTMSKQTNISILFYGLLKDFRGRLFDGSMTLIESVDDIREIKTVCAYCEKKATFNLKVEDGKPTYAGEQIQIGDIEYKPVCYRHYHTPA